MKHASQSARQLNEFKQTPWQKRSFFNFVSTATQTTYLCSKSVKTVTLHCAYSLSAHDYH